MWTAKHVNSQVLCLLSAYPELTIHPLPLEQNSRLASPHFYPLQQVLICSVNEMVQQFSSQHPCCCTHLGAEANAHLVICFVTFCYQWLHIIHWCDCSTPIFLFTLACTCRVFLYSHEGYVFEHFEHLDVALPLATVPSRHGQGSVGILPHMFKSHVSLLCLVQQSQVTDVTCMSLTETKKVFRKEQAN